MIIEIGMEHRQPRRGDTISLEACHPFGINQMPTSMLESFHPFGIENQYD